MNQVILLEGGTTSTSGGTNMTFNPVGKTVVNGKAFGNAADSDLSTREEIITKSISAQYNATTGKWSKQRSTAQFVVPYLNAAGEQFFSLVRIQIEVAPEHLSDVSTVIDTLREMGAQLLVDSEMDDLWNTGAI
jgi:hypothetical protein